MLQITLHLKGYKLEQSFSHSDKEFHSWLWNVSRDVKPELVEKVVVSFKEVHDDKAPVRTYLSLEEFLREADGWAF